MRGADHYSLTLFVWALTGDGQDVKDGVNLDHQLMSICAALTHELTTISNVYIETDCEA